MKTLGGEGGLWERLRDEDEDEETWVAARVEKGWEMKMKMGAMLRWRW